MARSLVGCTKQFAGGIRAAIRLASVFIWLSAGNCGFGTIYYWDATPGDLTLGGSGTWSTANGFWRPGSPSISPTFFPGEDSDNDVSLQGTAGTLTLVGRLAANDIYVAPTIGGSTFSLDAGELFLDGAVASQIDVATGTSLQIYSSLLSSALVVKTGLGTLVLDNVATNITGGFLLNAGVLQLGSTRNSAGASVFRGAPVNVASGTSLTAGGTPGTIRIGTLTGSGAVNVGTSTLYIHGLGAADPANAGTANTYFASGPVFSGSLTAGALNVSGNAGAQVSLPGTGTFGVSTFSGDVVSSGSLTVNSGSGLTFASHSGATAGVVGSSNVLIRGGALILDASQGNPTGAQGILPNSGSTVSGGGGTLILVGSPAGTTESAGTLKLIGGNFTVSVTQTSAAGATLSFNAFDRPLGSRSTLDFRSESGALGGSSVQKILVSGLTSEPWVTVNGADYILYSAQGVAPTTYSSLSTALSGSGNVANYYSGVGSFAKAGSTTFFAKGIRLQPDGAGQSFVLSGTADLSTKGILLPGALDYVISSTNTGGLANGGTAGDPRYIGVMEQGTTLTLSTNLKSPGSDVVKFGRGFLDIRGSNSAALTGTVTSFVINGGVLRATVSGSSAAIPANSYSHVALRGGVLEIAGGSGLSGTAADFTFALGVGGSRVNWATSTTDEGDGGFSAYGQDATVNIGGQAAPTSLAWDDNYGVHNGRALIFGSTKSDAVLILQNGVTLDSGAATNPYFARQFRVIDNPASSADAARISGMITGGPNADLLKTGDGTLQLTGANTFSGNIIVQEGVLQLGAAGGAGAGAAGAAGGTSKIIVKGGVQSVSGSLQAVAPATLRLGGSASVTDRVSNTAGIVLEGGKLETGGLTETFGTLSVMQTKGVVDLQVIAAGLGVDIIRFAGSADLAWTGTLQIWNWNGSTSGGGVDQIYIGTSLAGLRADQLVRISVYSDDGQTLLGAPAILSTGELVASVIPEPGTFVTCIGGIVFLISFRRFRTRWSS